MSKESTMNGLDSASQLRAEASADKAVAPVDLVKLRRLHHGGGMDSNRALDNAFPAIDAEITWLRKKVELESCANTAAASLADQRAEYCFEKMRFSEGVDQETAMKWAARAAEAIVIAAAIRDAGAPNGVDKAKRGDGWTDADGKPLVTDEEVEAGESACDASSGFSVREIVVAACQVRDARLATQTGARMAGESHLEGIERTAFLLKQERDLAERNVKQLSTYVEAQENVIAYLKQENELSEKLSDVLVSTVAQLKDATAGARRDVLQEVYEKLESVALHRPNAYFGAAMGEVAKLIAAASDPADDRVEKKSLTHKVASP